MSSLLDFSIIDLPKVSLIGKRMNVEPVNRSRDIFSFWHQLIVDGIDRDFRGLERYMYYNTYTGWTGQRVSGDEYAPYLAGKMFVDHVSVPVPRLQDYDVSHFGPCKVAKAVVKGDYNDRAQLSMDAHRLVTRSLADGKLGEYTISPAWRLEMFTPDYFVENERKHAILSYFLPLNEVI